MAKSISATRRSGTSADERASANASAGNISAAERVFDVTNAGLLGAMGATVPRRGAHLKVGDVISARAAASDIQRNGWTMEGGQKINIRDSVTITKIENGKSTITLTGEIKVGTRKGVTTRTVKKRFNKADRFMLES